MNKADGWLESWDEERKKGMMMVWNTINGGRGSLMGGRMWLILVECGREM